MKRTTLLLVLFALMFTVSAPSAFALDKVKEAEQLYKQAEKLCNTKPKNAIALLDKAISLNPTNPQYYYLRGYYIPDNGKAIQDFDRAVILNPDKYFNLCYGGDSSDAAAYYGNFLSFKADTKKWSIYDVDTVSKIKSYLSTYKGNTTIRLKNASTIMDAATGGSYLTAIAQDADDVASVSFYFVPDRENEITSNESLATMSYKYIKKLPEATLTSDITSGKVFNRDVAYFDYTKKIDGVTYIGRAYYYVANYYAFEMVLLAPDKEHFDAAVNEFINTMKKN